MRGERPRERQLQLLAGLAALFGFVLLGAIARQPGLTPLLVAVALVAVDIVLVKWALPRPQRTREASPRVTVLLATCWIAIALMPVHDFSRQSTQAAVSAVSLQTLSELLLFALVGAFSAYLLRAYVPLVPIGPALAILPVWVIASASWGGTAAYAIARGLEYVAMAMLAMATAGLAVRWRPALDEVVDLILRWTVRVTVLLVVAGQVLGPLYVVVTPSNRDRFTWPGAHPTQSGFVLGVAVLILVSTSSERLRVPRWVRFGSLLLTSVALYENQTRTVLVGLALGGVLLLVLHARRRPDAAVVGGFFIGGGAIVAVLAAGSALGGYFLRGGDSSKLTTLNGRTDLWGVGFDALHGPMDWLHGLGFGATRVVFVDQYAFAGDAHNSVLGTLVSLGVVGVLLLLAAVVSVSTRLWRSGILTETGYGPTLAALLAYTLVGAVTYDNLAEPHFGLTVLYLCTATAYGWSSAAPAHIDDDATREQHEHA